MEKEEIKNFYTNTYDSESSALVGGKYVAELINNLLLVAHEFHGEQKRKYTGLPYSTHLRDVTQILVEHQIYNPDILSASIFHDVIEDTYIKYNNDILICSLLEYLPRKMVNNIIRLIYEVTDISKLSDGNRRVRKNIDAEHILKASIGGKLIKLADLTDNTIDIAKNDKDFAKSCYLREKKQLLNILNPAKCEEKDIIKFPQYIQLYHNAYQTYINAYKDVYEL